MTYEKKEFLKDSSRHLDREYKGGLVLETEHLQGMQEIVYSSHDISSKE